MINNLKIENFKSFGKEQEIKFAPITLFYGRNNSGKSTIFDLLALLSENKKLSNLQVNNKAKGSPLNLIHGYNQSAKIGFKLRFCEEYYLYKSLRPNHPIFKHLNSRGNYDMTLIDQSNFFDADYEYDQLDNIFFRPNQDLYFGIKYNYISRNEGFFASDFYYQFGKNLFFNFSSLTKENEDIQPQAYLMSVNEYKSQSIDKMINIINDNPSLIINKLKTNKNVLDAKKKEIKQLKKRIKTLKSFQNFADEFTSNNKEIINFLRILSTCLVRLTATNTSIGNENSKKILLKMSNDFFQRGHEPNTKKSSKNINLNDIFENKIIFDEILIAQKNSGEAFNELYTELFRFFNQSWKKHNNKPEKNDEYESFDEFLFKSINKKINNKNFIKENFNKIESNQFILIRKFFTIFLEGLIPMKLHEHVELRPLKIQIKSDLTRYLQSQSGSDFFFNLMIYFYALNQIYKITTQVEKFSNEYFNNNYIDKELALTKSVADEPAKIMLITEKNQSYHNIFYLIDKYDLLIKFNNTILDYILDEINFYVDKGLSQIEKAINSIEANKIKQFFDDILIKSISSNDYVNNNRSFNGDLNLVDIPKIDFNYEYRYFDRYFDFFYDLIENYNKKTFPNQFTPEAIEASIYKSELSNRNELINSVVNVSLPALIQNFQKANININLINRTYIRGDNSLFDGKDFKLLNQNLKKFGIHDELIQKDFVHLNEDYFSVYLRNSKGHLTNIDDIGVGLKRILILLTCLDFKEKIIYLEEPESNIHPEFQKGIGTSIVDSWINGSNQILVETHSEQLILRILREIREGKLNHTDLSVNYVSNENSETIIKNIRVDEKGRFIDVWPQGFFNERLSEL